MNKIIFSKEKLIKTIKKGEEYLEIANKELEKAIEILRKRRDELREEKQNPNFELAPNLIIDNKPVPLHYVIGLLKSVIPLEDFEEAMNTENFSKYASLHYTGDALDFNTFGIALKKDLRNPEINGKCLIKCLECGSGLLSINYYKNNEACQNILSVAALERLAYPAIKIERF